MTIERELLDGAARGDLDAVRGALRSGAPLDAPAACTMEPAAVRMTLAHGGLDALAASLPAGDRLGRTALLLASAAGAADVVAFLIEAGAAIDARDLTGQGPLHVAAAAGHAGVCERLLAAKASTRAGPERMTPMMMAAEAGHLAALEVLLGARATPKQKTAALERAAFADRVDCIRTLLAAGADPNLPGAFGFTPLGMAACKNRVAAARALLAGGADVDFVHEGAAPLHTAMTFRAFDVVEVLLEAGARRSDDRACPYLIAATIQDAERLVCVLLAAGYDPNEGRHLGKSALQHARRLGREAIAALLIAAGAREPE